MSDTPRSAASTVARRRSALERGDVDATATCLSADVELAPRSPNSSTSRDPASWVQQIDLDDPAADL